MRHHVSPPCLTGRESSTPTAAEVPHRTACDSYRTADRTARGGGESHPRHVTRFLILSTAARAPTHGWLRPGEAAAPPTGLGWARASICESRDHDRSLYLPPHWATTNETQRTQSTLTSAAPREIAISACFSSVHPSDRPIHPQEAAVITPPLQSLVKCHPSVMP